MIGLLRLNVLIGNFDMAINVIQPIDYKKLTIYSKAFNCYITLFYYAGFSFLMSGREREAARIFDTLL